MTVGEQAGNAPLAARNVAVGVYAQLAQTTTYYPLMSGGATALSGASVAISPVGRSDGTARVAVYIAATCAPEFPGSGWTEYYGGVKLDGGTQTQMFRVWSQSWEFAQMQGMMTLNVTPGAHTFQVYVGANSPYAQYSCNSFVIGAWEL